jgi:hypothetical protein
MGKKRKTYIGETIGYLEVLNEHCYQDDNGVEVRECDCYCSACGKIVKMKHRVLTIARSHAVAEGKMPSCGCMKYSGFKNHNASLDDLSGKRFENLLVLESGPTIVTGKDNKKRRTWKCLCDCGQITFVTTGDLVSGNTKSCGCLISVGQKRIAEILTEKNIKFEEEYSFNDLLSHKGNPLRFDFAVFNKNNDMFLIEYQGEQHYSKGNSWFGKLQRDFTDDMKRQYCQDHDIKLYEIAYNEDITSKLENILQFAHDNTVPSPQS